MERHKLWNDRAEKLMRKTLESWSKDKKKKVYEDEDEKDDDWWEKRTIQHQKDWEERIRKSAIEMGLDPDEISGPDFPSNMPDGSWREHPDDEVDDSVEIFGADSVFNLDDEDEEAKEELDESPRYGEEYADMDGEEPQGNDNPSQDVYAMLDNLRSKVVGTPLEGDVLAIMDKMDANPEMTDTKYGDHTMAEEFGDQGQLSKDMDKARASSDKRSDAVGGRITNVSKLQDVMVSQVRGLMQSAEKVGEKELTLVLRNLLKNVNQLVPQEGGGEIAEGISAKIKTLQSKLNALKKK